MPAKKPSQPIASLADRSQAVKQTIMGKSAQGKASSKPAQLNTVLGGTRGK